MDRYMQIAALLTLLTAVSGLLTAFTNLPAWVVAICGVMAGLWWAFGKRFVPHESAASAERRAGRSARRP